MSACVRPLVATVAAAAGLLAAATPPALAEHTDRPAQPPCTASAHFVVHCDAGVASGYTNAAATDLEDGYAHEVAGGGGTPNAGFSAPVDDGDGRTDVYLMAPPDQPSYSGGLTYRDPAHTSGPGQAAYAFITPDLSLARLRLTAAHEFVHVLLRGYFGARGTTLEEAMADWGAEQSVPDAGPRDSNFGSPQTPLDCSYGDWKGTPCGNGYWQWLFFQRQSEDFGADFVKAVVERAQAFPDIDVVRALREELAARTGRPAGEALRARFDDYARKVWDPTAWHTGAVAAIYREYRLPAAEGVELGAAADTGDRTAVVDHLAADYVQVDASAVRPDDDLRITVTPPPGLLEPPALLVGSTFGPRSTVALSDAGGPLAATLHVAAGSDVVLPLINDSESNDGLSFTWRAQLFRVAASSSIPRQRLKVVRKKGLAMRFNCSKPCAVSLDVSIDKAAAHTLGLRRRTIATIRRRELAAGTSTVRVKLPAKARKRLRRLKVMRLSLIGYARFAAGTQVRLDRRATLRR